MGTITLEELETRRNDAIELMDQVGVKIDEAGDDADLDVLRSEFDEAERSVVELDKELETRRAVVRAREQHTPRTVEARVEVGREEPVYRPDQRGFSFFGDVIRASEAGGSEQEARERIARHRAMVARDVTAAAGAAGVVPPSYLPEFFAPQEAYVRPFVNSLQRFPMPTKGTSHTIPVTATSPTAAVQSSENSALSETDADVNTQTYYTAAFGGIQDMSLQAYDLTDPAFDALVMGELMARYYEATEGAAFTGAGTAGLYLGLDNVSGIQTTAYTDADPTQAELLPKVYEAISEVHSNHYSAPDCIVMHPRRSSWLAAGTSTSTPLFQQGGLMQAHGQQNEGIVGRFAGLPVIASPAITTTDGSGTNEDVIYVVAKREMFFAEGPHQVEVFRSPGSNTGTVRIRLFAYSLLVAGRYANAISKISGTGLVTPSF